MASLYTVPLPSVFPAPAPHEWNSTFQAKPKHHWMLPFPISDTQHCESETASAKSACIYFGLDFLIRKDLLRLGWFSVVMSSIGSGLFSRLSRNSVRELLSPLLGEGFSWLMGFGLWTSRTPVFYQMGLKELPVRELYFGDSTGFESLPTETSCRSGNCARILVSKLSESGNTTFSVDHHDDASSKTTCGETYALLVVGSTHLHPFFCSSYPVKIHRIAFFSNFVRPVEDKDVANAPAFYFGVLSGPESTCSVDW